MGVLALERRVNESIDLSGGITITVRSIRGLAGNRKVTLAIQAPDEITVHRREITEAIARGEGK